MANSVLITGAGPVGLTLACELVRYRVPVRIIEKAAQRTDKSKALVVWSRTLELLDRGGDSKVFVNAGFKALAVNLIAGDKLVGRISMEGVKSAYPFGLMLPQSETERLLEERLNSLGVRVEREVELTAFTPSNKNAEAVLRHADGHEERVSADWLIGCDGAHSTVRHGVGATFSGETMNSDWILADVHMTGYPCPDSEVSVYWHQDGAFVIFPISPGRYRVIADLPATSTEVPPTPTLEEVQATIDRRGPSGLKAFDPIWLAGFRINGRKVSEYRWGRVFLAGDASHVHSPAGGQGMNTGMQDAINLSWKLALVAHGICGEDLLNSYSPERSAVGDEVLKMAGRLTEIGTLKNPVARSLRNIVGHVMLGLAPVQHVFADNLTEISLGYPHSPLNGPSLGDGPKPGERVAPKAGEVPVGSGDMPRFALFAQKNSATETLAKEFSALIDPNIRPAIHEDGIWLVRPDGYVACAAKDPRAIGDYLKGSILFSEAGGVQ